MRVGGALAADAARLDALGLQGPQDKVPEEVLAHAADEGGLRAEPGGGHRDVRRRPAGPGDEAELHVRESPRPCRCPRPPRRAPLSFPQLSSRSSSAATARRPPRRGPGSPRPSTRPPERPHHVPLQVRNVTGHQARLPAGHDPTSPMAAGSTQLSARPSVSDPALVLAAPRPSLPTFERVRHRSGGTARCAAPRASSVRGRSAGPRSTGPGGWARPRARGRGSGGARSPSSARPGSPRCSRPTPPRSGGCRRGPSGITNWPRSEVCCTSMIRVSGPKVWRMPPGT